MYNVKSTSPTEVFADSKQQKRVTNSQGGKVFYKTASDVDAEDTELAVGSSVVISQTTYFISASSSKIQVADLETSTVEDASVTDDLTIGGDLNHDGSKVGLFGVAPAARPEVKKAELTANELATELAKLGIVKVEA